MEKLYTMLLGLVTLVGYSNLNTATAQLNLGAGVSYATDIEEFGADLRGGYLIGDKLNLQAVGHIFSAEETGNVESRWTAINLNAQYWIGGCDGFAIYPMAGANLSTLRTETFIDRPDQPDLVEVETETELGLNLGGGIAYRMKRITPFIEGKYVTGDFEQGVFTAGLLYIFD